MKNKIVLLLTFFTITIGLKAQTLVFDLTANEKQIGQISVKRSQEGGLVKIDVLSEVKVKVLVNINLSYNLSAEYKNGELEYCKVNTFVNGKPHSASKTEKVNGTYTITKDGEVSKFLQSIPYSGALLYWKEPKNVSKVYSEIDNIEKSIKNIGLGHYRLSEPKTKRSSDYFYKNGTLEKAIIQHAVMTFELTKK